MIYLIAFMLYALAAYGILFSLVFYMVAKKKKKITE